MNWALETFELTKRFPAESFLSRLLPRSRARPVKPPLPAVDCVSLRVAEGELFGLLGPNGAGKTTLIKLLSTLITPTSGTALINGFNLAQETAIKSSIGVAGGDDRSFFWRLTGRQNLEFFARLQGIHGPELGRRVVDVFAQVELEAYIDRPFSVYSTGMRQRLTIARALLHRPRLLFLDEPTRGLDPNAARAIHQLVKDELVERQGLTVFLTTHNLDEAEKLCQRVAVLHNGKIQACDTPQSLRSWLGLRPQTTLLVGGLSEAVLMEMKIPGLVVSRSVRAQADLLEASLAPISGDQALNRLLAEIYRSGGQVLEVRQDPASLEPVFRQLTLSAPDREHSSAPGRHAAAPPPNIPNPAGSGSTATPLRSHPPSSWRIALAFLQRDWRIETSYRLAFLLQFAGLFISAVIFYFISRIFGEAASGLLRAYGGDYFSFVLIGIAFAGYFGVGMSSFAASLRTAQTTGTLEAMLTAPARLSALILSASLWDYLLTTLKVLVHLGIGILLGVQLSLSNPLAVLLALTLSILAFTGLGVIAASFIIVFKRGDPVAWAINALAGLVGGVYYPIEVLPGWLEKAARLLPITYALQAMRKTLLMGAGVQDILPELGALALFAGILLPLSLWIFRLAVKRARLEGSLTHY